MAVIGKQGMHNSFDVKLPVRPLRNPTFSIGVTKV